MSYQFSGTTASSSSNTAPQSHHHHPHPHHHYNQQMTTSNYNHDMTGFSSNGASSSTRSAGSSLDFHSSYRQQQQGGSLSSSQYYSPDNAMAHQQHHSSAAATSDDYSSQNYSIHSEKRPSAAAASSSLNQSRKTRVKLHESASERDRYDNMAELYSLILTTEKLERAYVKDSIKTDAYVQACDDLIAKFKTFKHILGDINIEQFMAQYKMNCPAAYNRLCLIGVNATVEHGSGEKNNSGYIVLETTQHFITAMDSLRLNMRSVDELQPLMKVLVEALNKQSMIEFPAKKKMLDWLRDLNGMRASDELNEEQVRQLLHDLDNAYNEYGGEIKKDQQ